MAAFTPQTLPAWRRAVLKVGSSLLAGSGGLDLDACARARRAFIAAARWGPEVVLVSSGAVAAGRGGSARRATASRVQRQALAALGQALMGFWQSLSDVPVAQVFADA